MEKRRKKILSFIIIFLLLGIVLSYFYLIKNQNIHTDNKVKKVLKKYQKQCFLLKDDVQKRTIVFSPNSRMDGNGIGGYDLYRNNELKTKFVFLGVKTGNLLGVYSINDGVKFERIYKLEKDGIIEGWIGENNRKEITGNKEKYSVIVDKTKIKYDIKFLIPKVNCDLID